MSSRSIKIPAILFTVAAALYVAMTIGYLLAGKYMFAAIWSGTTLVMTGAAVLQWRAYRSSRRTAEIYRRLGRR